MSPVAEKDEKGLCGRSAGFAIIFGCTVIAAFSFTYHVPLQMTLPVLGKEIATPFLDRLYANDLVVAKRMTRAYFRGDAAGSDEPSLSWKRVAGSGVELLGGNGLKRLEREIPFVFEKPASPHLTELSQRYRLQKLVTSRANDEYGQMLALFRWLGTRWDHGGSPVPGGVQYGRPAEIIAAGESGSRFWCEVAAHVTVQASTALGWPARLVTASRDGYHWDHALAEVWSNRFNKWFVVDTDYNVIYEVGGTPLSAYEMCHFGPSLRREGRLIVRRIAPLKHSLRDDDLLGLYRYVHIDLRNDWYTRRLRPGSPAGGESSTWWTAREDFGPILTAKVRVDDQKRFDWLVNAVELRALRLEPKRNNTFLLDLGLCGYAPYFNHFEIRIDGGEWSAIAGEEARLYLSEGRHGVEARMVTFNGGRGPSYGVFFLLRHASGRAFTRSSGESALPNLINRRTAQASAHADR